jgi:hypothetical protein
MESLEERVAQMPSIALKRLALACLVVSVLALVSASAGAASIPAHLRVLNTAGKVLADQVQYTGTVRVPTSPAATCFGSGSGGSGDRVTVRGATALGVVQDASTTAKSLRPLRITDSFSFGLGVCGFGRFGASGNGFWYLKVNHKGAQVGGDQLHLRRGDEVLWYLSPTFPAPQELSLVAPRLATVGQPFGIRVFAYDDAGHRSPVAGARVRGAAGPTGADGRTTVTLARSAHLRAEHGPDIPSDSEFVCVSGGPSGCPAAGFELIAGTAKAERIVGTAGPNRVLARAGNDHLNLRGGGHDTVDCGPGRDTAVLDRGDGVAMHCETTIRR